MEANTEIREAVAKLCAGFPGPYWRALDREMAYPTAFVNALTESGYLSVLIPEAYGGSGLGLTEASVIMEEINRAGGKASEAALNSGLAVLERGELLGLYPEGTRSPDGRLYRGRTGVARMALTAGVPVIPVAMIDTDKAQPTGQIVPNIRRVGVKIGKPLDFSRYEGMEGDRFVRRSITDEIMYEIMRLSGQEYVDVYASTVKDRIAARAKEIGGTAVAVGSGAAQAIGQRVARKSGEDDKSADGAEPDTDDASVAGDLTDTVTDTAAKAPGTGA